MDQSMNYIVGKTGEHGTWLPLWIHGMDTMDTACCLVREWLSVSIKNRLCRNMREEELLNLVAFLSLVHDIGKITPCFQRKITTQNDFLRANLNRHDLLFQEEKEGLPHGAAGEAMLISMGCNIRIAAVVGAHHGKPTESDGDYEIRAKYNVNHKIGDSKKNNRPVWKEIREQYLNFALETAGYASIDELPTIDFEQQVLLTGLLIMADWLASNTDYFPLIGSGDFPYRSSQRSSCAWEKIDLPDRWIPHMMEMEPETFRQIFGFSPNEIQRAAEEIASQMKEPGVMIIEAPMGVGKTEAALAAAEVLASHFGSSGLYFGLPTQATANGIFPRLEVWADGRTEGGRHSIRLAHRLAELNEAYARFLVKQSDVSEEGLFVHEWFSGRKKVLLSDFVIGTVDQLLMMVLRQKHVMLRHLGLSGKVVIIDECHAYDDYMNQYLDRALMWLASYGVPVILLSATLPSERRDALTKAYLSGREVPLKKPLKAYDEYPLITYTDGNHCYQRPITLVTAPKKVQIFKIQDQDLEDILKAPVESGAAIGILCNTVRRAQEIYRRLKEGNINYDIMLCHAQFISEDRAEWEKLLMQQLGKASKSEDRRNRIVIGTQVLEQSLDIDFDFMITELCPMDLLLQRIGRLHRHQRQRPKGMEIPQCHVMFPEESNKKASETIYGKWLLMRTEEELPETICLPNDISPLVQRVYSVPENQEEPMYRDYIDDNARQRARASRFLLCPSEDTPKDEWEFTSLLNGMLNSGTGSDSEEAANAAVRDSIASIEVLILQRNGDNSYSFLPWRENGAEIDANAAPDSQLASRIARQRLRLPFQLSAPWNAAATVETLQKEQPVPEVWLQSPVLKHELFLFLDQSLSAKLGDYVLHYSKEIGFTVRKGDENESGI